MFWSQLTRFCRADRPPSCPVSGAYCRARHRLPRRFMTRSDISRLSIDAVRTIHSITSSARTSSDVGTVKPSVRATFKLITSSIFVDC